MAFMGMVLGAIFIVILLLIAGAMLLFYLIAIILKIIGKSKDNKKVKTAGTVFIVIGSIFAAPLVLFAGYAIFTASFIKAELPDGKTAYVSVRSYNKMIKLLGAEDERSIDELSSYVSRHPNLVHVHDSNNRTLLEYGLDRGSYQIVSIAIDNGAEFDDPSTYEILSYIDTSMEYYIEVLSEREVTEEDVEILELMFDNGASLDLCNYNDLPYYSNILGKALWAVLYNDRKVTPAEVDLIKVFVDNGISSDPGFLFIEDVPSNYTFSESCYGGVTKDDNYWQLVRLADLPE